MTTPEVQIEDLTRLPGWKQLLPEIYARLYTPNFPDTREQEQPADWLPRLERGRPEPPQPLTYILVAGDNLQSDDTGREVHGFIVAELYQRSMCALLTYVVVSDDARNRGLGRELVNHARDLLNSKADQLGGHLEAIFAEVDNPHASVQRRAGLDPYARVNVMYRLGARHVPIEYVQPELHKGQGSSADLMLMAFPIDHGMPLATMPAKLLKDFLDEFCQALGVANPREDPDYQQMTAELTGDTIELQARCAEEPQFTFHTCGIAVHFVCDSRPLECSSRAFDSFERDLTSFSYREHRPWFSKFRDMDIGP